MVGRHTVRLSVASFVREVYARLSPSVNVALHIMLRVSVFVHDSNASMPDWGYIRMRQTKAIPHNAALNASMRCV